MSLAETLKDDFQDAVDNRLKELGVDAELLKKSTGPTPEKLFSVVDQLWRQNGWTDPEDRYKVENGKDAERDRCSYNELVTVVDQKVKEMSKIEGLEDAVETTSARLLIPRVITKVVKEAAEPFMIGMQLMRRINFSAGDSITFPASGGGMWAEDIPEGGEYPEQTLDFAGMITAKIGKSGLKVRITEEMLRFSLYDVMTMHVQSASRALIRHKEKKIFDLINSEGTTTFDNSGGASTYGTTTGRAISGLYNKTITLDDLFVMYADMLDAGFIPNVLLMNPMGWLIFARDGVMRNFGFMNGGSLWQSVQGQPGQGPTFGEGGVNMGPSAGMETPGNLNPQASTYTPVPSLFPAPLAVMVSPFIAFDATNRTTDIAMADRNELGLIVVDEDVVTESWNDPRRDIKSTKLRERYGLALDNQGEAVRWAKNVRIAKNYDWEDNLSLQWQIGTGTLPTGFVPGI